MNGDVSPRVSSRQVSPRLVAAAIVTILALVFAAQNGEDSRIEFLWMDIEIGLWLALLVTFLFGLVVGWLVSRSGD